MRNPLTLPRMLDFESTDPEWTPRDLQCLEVWGDNRSVNASFELTGLDAWVWSRSLRSDGGGDLYFASSCGCAEISRFALADVVGHEENAATLAVLLRSMMKRYIGTPDQRQLAAALNLGFSTLASEGEFATAIFAAFVPDERELILCNAGQPAPFVYRAATREWQYLEVPPFGARNTFDSVPLGIVPDAEYQQYSLALQPDDLVLLYTDGLSEARNREGSFVGMEAMAVALAQCDPESPGDLLNGLENVLRQEFDVAAFRDDATAILLRANGRRGPHSFLRSRVRAVLKAMGMVSACVRR